MATSSYASHNIPLDNCCSHRGGPKKLFRRPQILLTAIVQRADCLRDHQRIEHAAEVVRIQVKCHTCRRYRVYILRREARKVQ